MSNEMTEEEKQHYGQISKRLWAVYTTLCIALIAVLVIFKAADNEERIFYFLMGSAALYVFRPSEKFMDAQIKRFMKPGE